MSTTAVLDTPRPAVPTGPELADLILLRLLPAATSVSPAALQKDVAVFFHRAPDADAIVRTLAALRAEGFVTAKGQQVTDAGRARALQFLGVEGLPPRSNWGTVKAKFLVPRALGTTPEAVERGDKLAATLLKRDQGLPVATGNTLNAVFEAIACQALGFPDHTELKSLVPLLLARKMGAATPPGKKDAPRVVPRVLLGAPVGGTNGLRAVALRGWADGPPSRPQPEAKQPEPPQPRAEPEPFDLEAFANTVKAVARTCPTKEFGAHKAFISHVWERLRADRPFAALGLDGFKAKLVEANRERLLTLSRADLVQFMDPADVRASEVRYLTATFHFVLNEGS
ncbi:MAG TPA: hypothetical protein VGE74_07255 [Gemmata sp.]